MNQPIIECQRNQEFKAKRKW